MGRFLSITDINQVKDAWWLYLIGIFVSIFIIGGALFFAYNAKNVLRR